MAVDDRTRILLEAARLVRSRSSRIGEVMTLEQGKPLSGERMTAMYCGLLRKYYGEAEGVMKIDPQYCTEWAMVPHFYRDFYVYQYATSIAGAGRVAHVDADSKNSGVGLV